MGGYLDFEDECSTFTKVPEKYAFYCENRPDGRFKTGAELAQAIRGMMEKEP